MKERNLLWLPPEVFTTLIRKVKDIKGIRIGNRDKTSISHVIHQKSNRIYLYTIKTNKKIKQDVQIQDTKKSMCLSLPNIKSWKNKKI